MKTFNLEILTPEKPFFVGPCVSLIAPTIDGMIGIYPNHPPLTAPLQSGIISYTLESGESSKCAVSRGILCVEKNSTRLLCDSCCRAEDVDIEEERRLIEEATLALKEKQSHADYVTTKLTLAKAFNELKLKKMNL